MVVTKRGVLVLVLAVSAVLLTGVAVTRSLRSFDLQVSISGKKHVKPVADPLEVTGRCRAAISTAWNNEPKDHLRLWAVTVGTSMQGYTPVFGSSVKYTLTGEGTEGQFPDSWCGGEGRHRLIVSGGILAGGIALAVLAFILFRKRPTAAPNSISPS